MLLDMLRTVCPTIRRLVKIVAFVFVSPLVFGQNLQIGLFVPNSEPFWRSVVSYAKSASTDLGVDLREYSADSQVDLMLTQVRSACQSGIDGIVFSAFQNNGEAVLQIAERYAVPAISVNSIIGEADFLPRTKYEY